MLNSKTKNLLNRDRYLFMFSLQHKPKGHFASIKGFQLFLFSVSYSYWTQLHVLDLKSFANMCNKNRNMRLNVNKMG